MGLTLRGNPFCKLFTEYQFFSVIDLESLVELDKLTIDDHVRNDFRQELDKIKKKGGNLDFVLFDAVYQDRERDESRKLREHSSGGLQDPLDFELLVDKLNSALNHPDELM